MTVPSIQACLRCGTCCKKGGPGLHQEDRELVESGKIQASALFTLRAGELARDNVNGLVLPLADEMIKIKGTRGRWTCLFFDEPSKGCEIYEHRPLECRALNCRDTSAIEQIYAHARLTRKDLLAKTGSLWELIDDHESRCSYRNIKRLVDHGTANGRLMREGQILEIMRYDAHLRQLTIKRAGMAEGMLDFLFGRPLSDTIKMFRLKLVKDKGHYRLIPLL
jgi:Fe-S-cluster containining protein